MGLLYLYLFIIRISLGDNEIESDTEVKNVWVITTVPLYASHDGA